MSITYRPLFRAEEAAVLDLWVDVLGDDHAERQPVFSDFADDPQRFAHTQVAVAPDGSLLAAAAYWLREIRDARGTPQLIGHVWGVATRADARRQGHAAHVMRH